MLPSELIGGDVNRQEFVNAYMKLLDTGLSILGQDSRLSLEETQVLKAFLIEGYGKLLKKYKKTRYQAASLWMEKQIGKTGVDLNPAAQGGKK
jgi:hypothetical protein